MKFSNLFLIILAILSPALLAGCADDPLDNSLLGEDYPEGNTLVNFALDFEPFAASETGGESTRSLGGKTMDLLDDFCLLAYDLEGNLMEGFPMEITESGNALKVTSQQRTDANASNGQTAESYTRHATFRANLPYGNYYLYGVANLGRRDKLGRIASSTLTILLDPASGYSEDILTREGFLNHQASWDTENPLNNFEMVGNFTNNRHDSQPMTSEDMNNVRISIAKPGLELHTWLRRCASKVTVDFDGSGLRENIKVYIRRATIHDIPTNVKLGRKSAPLSTEELLTFKDANYRPTTAADGITYGVGDVPEHWPYVSKGHPSLIISQATEDFQPSERVPDYHNETAPSLFLYENMQGDSLNDKTNKEQHPAADGTVIGASDMKDEMPLGSYIEVEAYYEFSSKTEMSEGKIIYRFMLGKDTLKNFDVERNHHMKLTLCLRGNGNDVDWHIEYDRADGFEYKDPYYVSYLFNHDSTIHFRYNPPAGRKVVKLEAEIVGNEWWPDDASTEYFTAAMLEQSPFSPEERKLNDLTQASFTYNKYTSGELAGKTRYLGNGFLSLRSTNQAVLTFADNDETKADGWSSQEAYHRMNDKYFYGISSSSGGIDRSYREFNIANPAADPENTGREAYTVENNTDGSMRISIPVFTRAKNLVKETAYSGQNVYDGSRRIAYIRVTVTLDNGDKPSKVMRVVQVPRIPNPKGIYRRSRNNENFNVTLMELPSASAASFRELESDGPWMAEVLTGDENFITLNGRTTVSGSTGSTVKFNVLFNKLHRDEKVRHAVIRVRYHNYTCVHLIFVRQGYDPVDITPGGAAWEVRNFIHGNLLTEDPRDEGSMFKYGNIDMPIDASSNEPTWAYNTLPASSDFKRVVKDLKIVDVNSPKFKLLPDTYAWSDFNGEINSGPFTTLKVATPENFRELICSKNDYDTNTINARMSHGFGVLYADGATEVKQSVAEAYGYTRDGDQSYGMRGVFAYYYNSADPSDSYNCRNIFFPIGRAGHGHRRANDAMNSNPASSIDGTLRYAVGRTTNMDNTTSLSMPFFFDLWRRPGAIYWCRYMKTTSDVTDTNIKDVIAFDLNYYTLDVNLLPHTNLQKCGQWSGCAHKQCIDACFLRGVK